MQKPMLFGGRICEPILWLAFIVLWIWFFFGSNKGRIEATRFIAAPGVVEYAWGGAFDMPANERPCNVPEIEKVRFKVQSVNPPQVLYSCNTWWLDNLGIVMAELTGNGSREDYVEESTVLPTGYKPRIN